MHSKLDKHAAVYTGMFDPIHYGHLNVIARGSVIFDRLVVGVGINPDKAPFFTLKERVELVKFAVAQYSNVEVKPFEGLAVQFVRSVGARIMLRGLRTTSDMEGEFQMSLMNLNLDPELETVFLMAKDDYSHLSSSLLRQIATLGGALENFMPLRVKEALEARVQEQKKKQKKKNGDNHG